MCRRRPYTGLTYKHDLLESLVPFLREHSVAEIGVGTGYSCFALAGKTAHVTGIDIDRDLIDALENYARTHDNLHFLRDDATSGSPPEELRSRMDIVFSMDTLQYIEPTEGLLSYMGKLLKPDGRAIVCFPNELDEVMEGTVNFKQLETLTAVIDAAGLRPVSIRAARHTRWFNFITRNFWYRAKKLACGRQYDGKTCPRRFSETVAFRMLKDTRAISLPIRAYTAFIMTLLRAGGVYEIRDSSDIYGEYIILILGRKTDG